MPPENTPPELIASIRAGDRQAFEQLFRAWHPRLVSHAAHFLGRSDAAEDAVQEVFIAIWRRKDSLPDAHKLAAYLHRAVRNRALNQLRGTKGVESWSADLDQGVTSTSADADLHEMELSEMVNAAMATLAPRTREIFLLSRDQGRTYGEIAEALGISIKTVETLMGRALKTLRHHLEARLREP